MVLSTEVGTTGISYYILYFSDILECNNCGIIYRSRQYWYGNPEVQKCVHEEVVHVWPEVPTAHILEL